MPTRPLHEAAFPLARRSVNTPTATSSARPRRIPCAGRQSLGRPFPLPPDKRFTALPRTRECLGDPSGAIQTSRLRGNDKLVAARILAPDPECFLRGPIRDREQHRFL